MIKKPKKSLLASMLIMLMIVSISGCSPKSGETRAITPAPSTSTKAITVTDLKGNVVTFEKIPERIVSLSPSNTEILFAVGAGDKVVGITSFCNYPTETAKIGKIGDFNGPSLELIKKADPDVVLAGGSIQEDLIKTLNDNGIKVISTEAADFASIYKSIELIGAVTGNDEKAKTVVSNIENTLKEVVEKTKDKPKKKVFYVVWTDPLMTAGNGTFIDEIIKAAGGENVASKVEGWANYSAERLTKDNPEMLISAFHSTDKGMAFKDFSSSQIFGKLRAVKNGKIYIMANDDIMSRPGPRIAEAIKEMAKAIHGIE